jgi:putative iron-dependent peroxidase
MSTIQAGIAARVPAHGRYLSLALRPGTDDAVRPVLRALAAQADGLHTVVGLGATLVARLDAAVPGLRSFSAPPASRVDLPATPAELWLWLRGEDDPGALLQRGRALARLLAPAFDVTHELAAFRHQDGRDLTGYEDGTENPTGRDMVDTIGVQGQGPGLDGGSFVAVQQWEHALDRFDRFDRTTQDRMVGRRRDDNVELDDAPPSAHVQRTAQESFSPEAFVVRRSMPWAEAARCGLLFTAFATGFDAFEAQLARMAGVEDGVVDDLFRFSQPVTGAYFWCPPVGHRGLDLSRVLVGGTVSI